MVLLILAGTLLLPVVDGFIILLTVLVGCVLFREVEGEIGV